MFAKSGDKENMITVHMHIDEAQAVMDVVAKMVGLLIVYPEMRRQVHAIPAIHACMEIVKADKSGRLRKRIERESDQSAREIMKMLEGL